MLAGKPHRLLRILKWTHGFIDHGQVARNSILDHERGNAVVDEEVGLLCAFEFEREPRVSTTRKNDDAGARGSCLGGQVNLNDWPRDILYPTTVRRRFLIGTSLRVWNRRVTI